ncbi:hypothetical protein AK830_g9336 [Neonectria ditissima]|uniref:Uncharacterized protein n=1 Tax=Neonectria ditissima TaxID=78410 RepID=A0A0P7AIG8_9HYPO|nr:hypothetical protein AK830_g9336 [Neonectria ditissima]
MWSTRFVLATLGAAFFQSQPFLGKETRVSHRHNHSHRLLNLHPQRMPLLLDHLQPVQLRT